MSKARLAREILAEGSLADRLFGEDERAGEAESEGAASALDPFAAVAFVAIWRADANVSQHL